MTEEKNGTKFHISVPVACTKPSVGDCFVKQSPTEGLVQASVVLTVGCFDSD